MTFLKKYYLAATAMLLCLTSCLDEGKNSYSLTSVGVIARSAENSSVWWFMSDDSTTFAPANALTVPKDMHRVIAYMEFHSDITPLEGYHNTVNFTGLEPITVLPVTATDAAHIDTAPNDKLLQVFHGYTLQYLNLDVIFSGYDASKHTFTLLRDSLQQGEPVRLLLHHHQGDDSEYKSFGTMLSFDLETLAERGVQDSVRLRFVSPVGDSTEHTYHFIKN